MEFGLFRSHHNLKTAKKTAQTIFKVAVPLQTASAALHELFGANIISPSLERRQKTNCSSASSFHQSQKSKVIAVISTICLSLHAKFGNAVSLQSGQGKIERAERTFEE